MDRMSVDDKLGTNLFRVDEEHAHITVRQDRVDEREIHKLLLACPAHLYTLDEEGRLQFSYEGCLECGTCRVLCHKTLIREWDYPENGKGVQYRKS